MRTLTFSFGRRGVGVVIQLALLGATQAACSHPAAWPHGGVVTLGLVPPTGHSHTCTGTVVASSPSTKVILTARHCVEGTAGRRFLVTYERDGGAGPPWRTVPADVVCTGPSGPTPGASSAGPWDWQDDDWALLRMETPDLLPVIPLFAGDPSTAVPPGDPVELVSCFDYDEPVLRCHTHAFAFGDRPRELIEAGHSGAPILWHGQVIGTFIGGQPDWFLWYRRFWWLRTLDVASVAPVRAALAR